MKNKLLNFTVVLNLILSGVLCYFLFYSDATKKDFSNEVLKVRGLVVVDSSGVERVMMGAPLPDPTFHGYRYPRGGGAGISGILLFDSEGQERGGYVTDDNYGNVFLTLDSKTQQNALFLAEPQGAAASILWSRNGNKLSLFTDNDTLAVDLYSKGKKFNFKKDE
ncbi:hypothetical protein GWK08_14610 [Leptobacterium flavescens]|uniref:Uncharacterized protein n=1 Tax=Leptobacterium flavescens TaxID=472055 RepID=A0A6P0UND5_9FLAO|nr:hypothetical protein [Leptobacterium flavescens]NER14685.1 hypothetical protein [Leptobacterium flavescens]